MSNAGLRLLLDRFSRAAQATFVERRRIYVFLARYILCFCDYIIQENIYFCHVMVLFLCNFSPEKMTPLPLHEWKIEFSRFNYITSSLLSNQWTNGVIWSCCTIHFQDISIGTVDVRPGRIQNARSRNEIYLLADDAFHDELCAFWWLRSSRLRKSVTYRIYRTKRSGRFLYLHVSHDSNRICSTSFVVVVVASTFKVCLIPRMNAFNTWVDAFNRLLPSLKIGNKKNHASEMMAV